MIRGRRVVAIVPARRGSKGIPGKNTRIVAGRPLIEWTFVAARESLLLDHVLVSTDCPDVARIAANSGFPPPFVRPASLATDEASTVAVVIHALEYLQGASLDQYEYVVLLEPTSPIRTGNDIDHAIRALEEGRESFDGLVTIGRAKQHPDHMWRLKGANLEPYDSSLDHSARRQDCDELFFPYGIAYVAKIDEFLRARSFYVRRLIGRLIRPEQEIEVDTLIDLKLVELLLQEKTQG
jgi:CMP-N,N'-diacetyllegionaminic acid synthase